MRAFRRQLRSWHCHPDLQLCGRVRQLWSECYSQKDILGILLSEDFEITDRDVTLLRQNLGLKMRDPNIERRAKVIQGVRVETNPDDLERLKKRCEESDERLVMGTRRVRTRTWNGIPADDPDLQPRFPSEKTISACKKDLDLGEDRKKYIFVRDTFQRMCAEAGIIKKSHDPEAWEKVKLALVDAIPTLNRAYSQPCRPKKGDPMWFALDIICSDVAKKIRVLNTKMDIKQVKQTLKLNPHQVTTFRRNFVEILRDANFKSRFDVPTDDWNRLKKALYSQSSHLQAVLPAHIWDDKDDKRVKAFEYLCRDVTKRYKDRRGISRQAFKNEEVIKAEPESPTNRFQGPPVAEPEPSSKEVQELPLAEPKRELPIAPELLASRCHIGDVVNQKPVLRYTIDGFATVVFEPESSESGKMHQNKCALTSFHNESHTSVQNRDDSFSQFGTHAMHSTVENNHLSKPLVSDRGYFMHPFGPSAAVSIAHKDGLNVPIENGDENFMRRFGPSLIPVNEADHFANQVLENHSDFACQFGYGTQPSYSFMANDHSNPSATGNHDDYFVRHGLESHHMFPIVNVDYPNMPITGGHSDHLYHLTENHHKNFHANKGITQPEFSGVHTDPFSIPLDNDHGFFFPQLGVQPELQTAKTGSANTSVSAEHGNFFPKFRSSLVHPKAETNSANIPINEDHGDIFPLFGAQPELPIRKNDDSNRQIVQSIEVDSPFEIINNDPIYLGPDDFVSDRNIAEGSVTGNTGSCQDFEYPDPTDYGL